MREVKLKKLPIWSFYFNSIIEHWGLKELELSGRSFTWSNNQDDPLYVKLDRILVSPSWEQHFPLVRSGHSLEVFLIMLLFWYILEL